jgi:hypothetical protein
VRGMSNRSKTNPDFGVCLEDHQAVY